MSSITIAPPEHLQLQSPLLCLPSEIKNEIYRYCFQTEESIVDATVGQPRPDNGTPLNLGVSMLQTCRRTYFEADRRPLFSQNRFRFSTIDKACCFFRSLDQCEFYRNSVRDIELDARHIHSDQPEIAKGGDWGKLLGSLHEDSPGLKCLRLNFGSWPLIPMFRAALWNLLRNMLVQAEGLERVIVIGASRGRGMVAHAPWSPVHFVGGDDVGSDDLVERMWQVVRGGENNLADKVVRWERREGKLHLEVVTKSYLVKQVDCNWTGPCTRKSHTDAWPENGSCTWYGYQNRHSEVTEPTTKGPNPSAAE